ncbi:hypothetical protein HK102_011237, partial [Quaeritorhiza haematococci]
MLAPKTLLSLLLLTGTLLTAVDASPQNKNNKNKNNNNKDANKNNKDANKDNKGAAAAGGGNDAQARGQ